uniref:Lipid desaturase domain-containing protein n=1 Tax=Chromera velia CCMP2878 TaxID=1169474 RepID=A0A0G4GQ94_9ALVE|eukprot:Cvel_22897.t1-p1 / transcript=Cvel_22897.t1 / gene=Cvel_22897 / organism=Chromera_velia_CCMP2878 / gene_product=Transmembrane protein 189, putative / transcript_product=Transmembrane protein 189, putative / location=Cvel_scaffold2300:19123-21659(-) / protein_length=352 / sequence_SO=supercontig / SO=protein_coding / is_pseudo=false
MPIPKRTAGLLALTVSCAPSVFSSTYAAGYGASTTGAFLSHPQTSRVLRLSSSRLLSSSPSSSRRRSRELQSVVAEEREVTTSAPLSVSAPQVLTQQGSREGKGKGKAPVLVVEGDSVKSTPWQKGVVWSTLLLALFSLTKSAISVSSAQSLAGGLDIALGFLCALVFGDFFSGLFHWVADNYGNGSTPVFGGVIEGFQGHHKAPWTITYRDFENNTFKICYAAGAIVALSFLLLGGSPFWQTFWTVFAVSQAFAQEFHKYSHMTNPPALVRRLQDAGLILSRKEHGQHHNSPFEGHYCILFGFCNRPLDSIGFFRFLERRVVALGGHEPNSWKLDESLREEQKRIMKGEVG